MFFALKKFDSFTHLVPEMSNCIFGFYKVRVQFGGSRHNMFSTTHGEITEERYKISGEINQQDSTQSDFVVHKTDNGASNQPSTLNTGQKESIRMNKFIFGSEFLNERRNCWPKHPEARSDQRIHQVHFPNFYTMLKSENRNDHNNKGAASIKQHHQPPPVFAIDN